VDRPGGSIPQDCYRYNILSEIKSIRTSFCRSHIHLTWLNNSAKAKRRDLFISCVAIYMTDVTNQFECQYDRSRHRLYLNAL
jgi:hypothetical protein